MIPATELRAALLAFASDTRLYELTWHNAAGDVDADGPLLIVESFAADDRLQGIGYRDVLALAPGGRIALDDLLRRRAALHISLPDGTRCAFGGYVSQVERLGSCAHLARYRLRLSSWLWRLTQSRNCRVWQDKTVPEIVDEVFRPHRPLARWRWSDEVWTFIERVPKRVYCCQYRESDYAFISRLLGEEGLAWRFEDDRDGQKMVLFADSVRHHAVPRDPSCDSGDGIRFHRAHAGEIHDTIQAAQVERRLTPSCCTVVTYNEEAARAFSASADSRLPGAKPTHIEQFDHPGLSAFGNPIEAFHYACLRIDAHDVRAWRWFLRGTVRTLRAGTWFIFRDCPYSRYGEPELAVERVCSVGFNNLPHSASAAIDALFGPTDALLAQVFDGIAPEEVAQALLQARQSGYANCIEAFDANLSWRPLADPVARPTAHGSQTAIVVSPDGGRLGTGSGTGDVYCDALGRVRISFHWQAREDASSCWVRVAQRAAGKGTGCQFLPHIGQEVMVQFFENDIDRPVIVGALYNGFGEGGTAPTPGGKRDTFLDEKIFNKAEDHARAGHGNLGGGHSPVWHGASPNDAGHRNRAAQWGIRTKEFGVEGFDAGYNQLLFDDTDAQGRVQLKCTHAANMLTLGHLIHNGDNYRGSFRGTGIELRTDEYGSVRAGAGLLVASYAIAHNSSGRAGAGENQPVMALANAALQIAEAFSQAALTHQTVGLASVLGANAPLPALHKALSGMVSTNSLDAALAKSTRGTQTPHMAEPLIAISAQAGLGVVAGQDVQLCSGETASLMSGQETQFVTGGQMRVHTGQAIGVLGGAVKPGVDGVGLQMIAAHGAIDVQAQSDELKLQARDAVNVISANAHIDWAAAKKISLSTAGGANITIEGGNITVQCPGKLTVHAGTHSFLPPENLNYPLPTLPRSELVKQPLQFRLRLVDTPGSAGHPIANTPWKIAYGVRPEGLALVDDEKLVAQGVSDADGTIQLSVDEEARLAEVYCAHPDRTWIVYPGHVVSLQVQHESPEWNDKEKLLQALNAGDFSLELHRSHFEDGAAEESRYALEALAVETRNRIFPKIKS